jgi:hypothetical protein
MNIFSESGLFGGNAPSGEKKIKKKWREKGTGG